MYLSWIAMNELLGAPTVHTADDDGRRRELLRWACGCSARLETLRFYDVTACGSHATRVRDAAFAFSGAAS